MFAAKLLAKKDAKKVLVVTRVQAVKSRKKAKESRSYTSNDKAAKLFDIDESSGGLLRASTTFVAVR